LYSAHLQGTAVRLQFSLGEDHSIETRIKS
jgi:hypothetical protein